MSVITVQVGQCGNQVGSQFFSKIMEDVLTGGNLGQCTQPQNDNYCEVAYNRFFTEDEQLSKSCHEKTWTAKSVMVDMESKVIEQIAKEARLSGKWRYPDNHLFCQKRGSGNNWACGFCVNGPKESEAILNMVQTEVEKCDRLDGFLTLLSLAGGTGSGLGAYVTQRLRDEFPHCFLLNQVVWPYSAGEVIVQNYNAALTLSHLYQTSDAVLMMQNDTLQQICTKLLDIKKVSVQDLNKVISHTMASVLQPVYGSADQGSWSSHVTAHLGGLLEHLVAQPEYKLLSVRGIPLISDKSMQFSSYQWHGLLKHLAQMLIADAPMEEGIDWKIGARCSSEKINRSVATLLVLRGHDLQQTDTTSFQESHLYTPWMPADATFKQWVHPRPFCSYDRSAVLLSNSMSTVNPMVNLMEKAWSMFASRAYVHQYTKHGLTEDDFLDSFAGLEQIISSYKKL